MTRHCICRVPPHSSRCVFSHSVGVTMSKGFSPLVLLTPPQDLCFAGVQVPDCYVLGSPGHWVDPLDL